MNKAKKQMLVKKIRQCGTFSRIYHKNFRSSLTYKKAGQIRSIYSAGWEWIKNFVYRTFRPCSLFYPVGVRIDPARNHRLRAFGGAAKLFLQGMVLQTAYLTHLGPMAAETVTQSALDVFAANGR